MNFIFRGFEINPKGKEKIYINNKELIGDWHEGYFTRYARTAVVGVPVIETEWDSYVIDERTICPCLSYIDSKGKHFGHMDIITCIDANDEIDKFLLQWNSEGQEFQVIYLNCQEKLYGTNTSYFISFDFFDWTEFIANVLQNIHGIYKSIEITNNAFSDPNFFNKGIIPW